MNLYYKLICRNVAAVITAALVFAISVDAPADWPEFRGPTGDGHAVAPDLPIHWSETENITWKTPIDHRGWSTPVVMDGKVWMTSATVDGHDFFVVCVDAATGRILFNRRVFHSDNPEPLGNNVNCYASPSPVVEPGRVYVHFGTYGTACIDSATCETIWSRRDLPCRHFRGPGSSPIIFENLLILSFDGIDLQYVTALDKTTGKTVWKTDRSTVWHDLDENGLPKGGGDFRKAFSTPLIVKIGDRPLMVSLGSSAAFGYDPRTGAEIWKVRHRGHSSSARPVFGNGLAFITTGYRYSALWAVDVSGRGDVTDTHVAWRFEGRDAPVMPSPLYVDGLVFIVSDHGVVSCIDSKSGTRLWSERIGGTHIASPIYAAGRIYFFSVQGETTVLKAGRTADILATNRLDGGFMASPAVAGNALFLRTKTHLYRVETHRSGKE